MHPERLNKYFGLASDAASACMAGIYERGELVNKGINEGDFQSIVLHTVEADIEVSVEIRNIFTKKD